MGTENLKKSSEVWKCKHGCKVTKTPCKHLEKLLPKPKNNSIKVRDKDSLDWESDSLKVQEFETKSRSIETMLKKYFSPHEQFRVHLIMDRYVSNLSLEDIAKKYGYLDRQAVFYLIKTSLQILKAGGSQMARRLLGDWE